MCGFVGFVNLKEKLNTNSKIILEKMNNTLFRRGPDEDGYYISDNACLAHKRLIVVDPDGGKQPMIEHYSFGDYIICYNGQIYNTDEIKDILHSNNFKITTHSDTELLLKAYIHWGKDVVQHLNGIFAFAVWNTSTKELFIARDHFGVKPLFYTVINNTLVFGSEIKALFEYPSVEKILDSQGISELLGIRS